MLDHACEGFIRDDCHQMTVGEFLRERRFGKYTSMSLHDLIDIMAGHPDIVMVLDAKMSEPEMIELYAEVAEKSSTVDVRRRIIPQFYRDHQYQKIESLGFEEYWHTLYRESPNKVSPSAIRQFVQANEKIAVIVHFHHLTGDLRSLTDDFNVVLHTVNDTSAIRDYLSQGYRGVMTDFWQGKCGSGVCTLFLPRLVELIDSLGRLLK